MSTLPLLQFSLRSQEPQLAEGGANVDQVAAAPEAVGETKPPARENNICTPLCRLALCEPAAQTHVTGTKLRLFWSCVCTYTPLCVSALSPLTALGCPSFWPASIIMPLTFLFDPTVQSTGSLEFLFHRGGWEWVIESCFLPLWCLLLIVLSPHAVDHHRGARGGWQPVTRTCDLFRVCHVFKKRQPHLPAEVQQFAPVHISAAAFDFFVVVAFRIQSMA